MESTNSFAQTTVAIPDTNFRKKLLLSYPTLMTGEELNIAAAKASTKDMQLANCNIYDLTGIEYFISIYKLDIAGNKISTIPDISNYKNIQFLYMNNNKLTSLPSLSTLKNLIQLQVAGNKLTSLPSLTANTKLNQLYVSENKLTSLPDLSTLTNLDYLAFGNNPINICPDLSKNKKLTELQLYLTGISEIVGLDSLKMLKKLNCWGSKVYDLSDLDNNTVLVNLTAFNTQLKNLPVLTNKPNLSYIDVHQNKLTFEDLLPIIDDTLLKATFAYSAQDSVGVYQSLSVRSLDTLKLSITVDSIAKDYKYNWYRDTTLIATTDTNYFVIPSTSFTNTGNYSVRISHPKLPKLTLQSRVWNVKILNCMDLVSYNFDITNNECSNGAIINSKAVLNAATLPYRYYLVAKFSKDSIASSSGDFSHIAPGIYNFVISDALNCMIDTVVTIKKPSKCDPVITPNGDYQMSSYFIEEQGVAKILDISGKQVQQLNTPAVWYGTKSDGNLVDAGFYVILLNNKKLTNITVIR